MDIDGTKVAKILRNLLKSEIAKSDLSPKITFVLVGNHAPSMTYVRMKGKACEEVGIISEKIELPESITEEQLLATIKKLLHSPDGFLSIFSKNLWAKLILILLVMTILLPKKILASWLGKAGSKRRSQ